MADYTIKETYILPSHGKIYEDARVNEEITLRSMTTEEEMKRLAHSERPYKLLCEIIDDCIVGEKPEISSYDMCLGDYQFLLHRLRVVTYGSDYNVDTVCPYCNATTRQTVNIEELPILECPDDFEKYINITLPKTKKSVKLKMQTPRMIDNISIRKKEIMKKFPDMVGDPGILVTVANLIDTIDGEHLDYMKLEQAVRKLPMADTNYILKCAEKLNELIGINTVFSVECKECGASYSTIFRITPEFFGPDID